MTLWVLWVPYKLFTSFSEIWRNFRLHGQVSTLLKQVLKQHIVKQSFYIFTHLLDIMYIIQPQMNVQDIYNIHATYLQYFITCHSILVINTTWKYMVGNPLTSDKYLEGEG